MRKSGGGCGLRVSARALINPLSYCAFVWSSLSIKTMYSIAANNLVPHTKIIRAHDEEGIASYLESIALLNRRDVAFTCACAIIVLISVNY